jgi:outer membrane protein OmpA-like peptidoglycan-associated protein
MKTFVLIFLVLIGRWAHSQSLVLNGGFEDVNICTEFIAECAPEAWISSMNGFNNFFKDRKRSYKSANCMGIEAGHFTQDNRRTFIRTPLVCAMRAGAKYRIEFQVKSFHDVFDSLGVIFTTADPLYFRDPLHFSKASVLIHHFVDPLKFIDSLWYKVELIYTATGKERFMAMSYFAKKDYIGERSHPLENRYFVFFDDISLYPEDPHELPCRNYKERSEEIYDEDERHTMLEKKISYYRKNPPPEPPVMRTEYTRIDTLVLADILFASGKAELQPQSFGILDSFISRIRRVKVDSVVIEGHTDSVGTLSFNQQLSLARANAVRNHISDRSGVSAIISRGWAFLKPVAENSTAEGRQQNRRVEVLLYIRE